MLGRRWALAVVTTVFCFVAFLGVSWPRSLAPSGVSVQTKRALTFLEKVPPLPGSVPATGEAAGAEAPSEEVATDPGPTDVVARGNGRTLRVGFAGGAASPATVADAIGSTVGLYSEPGQAEPDDWADNPTWEGLPGVFLVHEERGDWLRVQVSMRPNQATAWIKASEVTTRTVTSRIVVDTGNRTLTAYNGGSVVLQADVAPGRGATPTPTGDFFVDGVVKLTYANGPYGAFQVSVAAFSNVHYSFGGGNGQIAIHGTNDPALIGTPASNGCVRMTNADITALAGLISLGTPVHIV
ncbi:MAG: L,D-transpeptidase [Acidimicrobiales bacterium]